MIGFLNKTLSPELVKNHIGPVILIWAVIALFAVSSVLFTAFLLLGSFTLLDLGLNARSALILDAILSIIFFLQHSIFVRRGFKKRLIKWMPDPYHPAFYGVTSSITLILVLLFWQKSPAVIASADGLLYWMVRGLFCLCLAGFAWGTKSLGSFDTLGVKSVMRHITGRSARPQQIVAKGPYRFARHPLYLFMIVLLWSCPVLTLDRLIFNILWTGWIVVGTVLEDRDLHREFGKEYFEYSTRVPMLIPYKFPRN